MQRLGHGQIRSDDSGFIVHFLALRDDYVTEARTVIRLSPPDAVDGHARLGHGQIRSDGSGFAVHFSAIWRSLRGRKLLELGRDEQLEENQILVAGVLDVVTGHVGDEAGLLFIAIHVVRRAMAEAAAQSSSVKSERST